MNIYNKPLVVLYEGISGAGKSSLSKGVRKKVNHNVLSIDRFTPSIWVYKQYRNEEELDINFQAEKILNDNFNVKVIWCRCPVEVAFQRCLDKLEEEKANQELMTQTDALFERYFNGISYFSSVLELDTTKNINYCEDLVVEFINE